MITGDKNKLKNYFKLFILKNEKKDYLLNLDEYYNKYKKLNISYKNPN